MKMLLASKWPMVITVLTVVIALPLSGVSNTFKLLMLIVLEVSLSFDNAVVNARVLERMSEKWQSRFLTWGIVVAVFGMRLVFPIVIVMIAAGIGPFDAVNKALAGGGIEKAGTYANIMHGAHESVVAFGGMFLLMVALDYLFEDKDLHWLTWFERPLERIGRLDQVSVVLAVAVLVVMAESVAHHPATVLVSGLSALVVYLTVNGASQLLEEAVGGDDEDDVPTEHAGIHGDEAAIDRSLGNTVKLAVGKQAFVLFMYLEILDASFSFDGVIGAFAITTNFILISVGLGIGALYIRSWTVFLVRQGTLQKFRYLEHGAHWAIGALAVIMFISMGREVPELVTGMIGVAFIGASVLHSMWKNHQEHGDVNGANASSQVPAGV